MILLTAFVLALAPTQTAAQLEANDALFLKLTTDANRALQQKDMAALDRILAKNFAFSMFVEAKAPQVLNRNETLKMVGRHLHPRAFEIRNLAARVFGNVAVVRFQPWRAAEAGGVDRSGEFAVVDVWVKDGADWRLSNRYQSRPDPGMTKP